MKYEVWQSKKDLNTVLVSACANKRFHSFVTLNSELLCEFEANNELEARDIYAKKLQLIFKRKDMLEEKNN